MKKQMKLPFPSQEEAQRQRERELKDYKAKLEAHDWFYEYSDDSRLHSRGEEEERVLKQLQRKLDPKLEIWVEFDLKNGTPARRSSAAKAAPKNKAAPKKRA